MSGYLSFPRVLPHKELNVVIRKMTAADAQPVLDFAAQLPVHDLLFLARDIRNAKVVSAWIDEINNGTIHTLLATREREVVGCVAIVRDQLSWSRHVGEIRLLLSPEMRGNGLGRLILQEGFALALALDLDKLTAKMTPDQLSAIALFEEMGFRPEALLRDHVRDANGNSHDIVVFSLSTDRSTAQREVYGMGNRPN